MGVSPGRLLQLKSSTVSDTLWCVEQILRADCFGALLVWLNHVQAASLRRLHLAAQSSETLFVMVRPDMTTRDASPATLRVNQACARWSRGRHREATRSGADRAANYRAAPDAGSTVTAGQAFQESA